jgi:hypothetical protein
MSIDLEPPAADLAIREAHAIEQVTNRLHARFPQLPPTQIETTVESEYHRFDDSRIRDYVAIFVERNVREELTALST